MCGLVDDWIHMLLSITNCMGECSEVDFILAKALFQVKFNGNLMLNVWERFCRSIRYIKYGNKYSQWIYKKKLNTNVEIIDVEKKVYNKMNFDIYLKKFNIKLYLWFIKSPNLKTAARQQLLENEKKKKTSYANLIYPFDFPEWVYKLCLQLKLLQIL